MMEWTSSETPVKRQKTSESGRRIFSKDTKTDCSWIAKSTTVKQTGYDIKNVPKTKQPKLLSSKSLSQLVPRNLFFRKNDDKQKKAHEDNHQTLVTSKSFPNGGKTLRPVISSSLNTPSLTFTASEESSRFSYNIRSDSLIGLPRQSSSNSFCRDNQSSTLTQSNLSPIVNDELDKDFDMSWTESTVADAKLEFSKMKSSLQSQEKNNTDIKTNVDSVDVMKDKEKESKKKVTLAMHKPFKTAGLVLKDVKNSIGLRLKARHESQAFTKLTECMATPPSKLYSPFDIYTDTSCTKASPTSVEKTVRRRINLNAGKQVAGLAGKKVKDQDKQSNSGKKALRDNCALPKRKQHLEQGNKFTFDSPTGRLRSTVKDVEKFQQCIEDISKAIQAKEGYE